MMSLFDDIIKAIPENTNLRVRVGELKTKVDLLESENASFKDDLREKDIEIATLKKENKQVTHVDEDPASTVLELANYLGHNVHGYGDNLIRFDPIAKELSRRPKDIFDHVQAACDKAGLDLMERTESVATVRRRSSTGFV